ncbi:DUF4307 domain-containing protein [Actinokineospora sp. PR83]|uniref:DUF4307 domain-containing protein n=1 Tax=Actinokineospora sp. PR83 TaxID=2884908 RepID=UPI001F1EC72F|nr:DUF4307 domain-containing protein [Actinokineospora sp. PR83]MCG8919992.1 DUF4307 domain-containing protein [Actinokineospora sp. PR83]
MSTATRGLPEGRYGKAKAPRSRRTVVVLTACGLALGAVVAWLAYTNLGSAPIETERAAFENLPDNRMRLTFEVTRATPEQPAVCVVRTRGIDGNEGGRKEVLVPAGPEVSRVSTVIRSTSEPVTADVFGCSYQVPAYLSTGQPPTG